MSLSYLSRQAAKIAKKTFFLFHYFASFAPLRDKQFLSSLSRQAAKIAKKTLYSFSFLCVLCAFA
jgi:hypothetical protein